MVTLVDTLLDILEDNVLVTLVDILLDELGDIVLVLLTDDETLDDLEKELLIDTDLLNFALTELE